MRFAGKHFPNSVMRRTGPLNLKARVRIDRVIERSLLRNRIQFAPSAMIFRSALPTNPVARSVAGLEWLQLMSPQKL